MGKTVIYEKRGEIAKIVLNRPDKMNAMNWQVVSEMKEALENIQKDDTVKVVVVTGVGQAFCAGGDLEYFLATKDSAEFYGFVQLTYDVFAGIENLGKPVIAAVNGYCLAGGFELISCCDLVIASEDAILGDEHINRGLMPGGTSVYRWGRILGPRKAKEVLWMGKRFTGKEAEALGIVNKAVPADKLEEAVDEIAKTLASKVSESLSQGKYHLNRAIDINTRTLYECSPLALTVNFLGRVTAGQVKAFVSRKKT